MVLQCWSMIKGVFGRRRDYLKVCVFKQDRFMGRGDTNIQRGRDMILWGNINLEVMGPEKWQWQCFKWESNCEEFTKIKLRLNNSSCKIRETWKRVTYRQRGPQKSKEILTLFYSINAKLLRGLFLKMAAEEKREWLIMGIKGPDSIEEQI